MTKLGEKVPTRVACLPDGGLGMSGAPLQSSYSHRLVVLPGGLGKPRKADRTAISMDCCKDKEESKIQGGPS
jgi:hypothetical protein